MENAVALPSMFDRINDPMAAIREMGEFIAASRMCGVTDPAQGAVVAMTCLAERKTPIQFDREYHIIEGRLSMRADMMLAKFRQLGGRVEWVRSDHEACVGRWSFENQTIELGYTLEDAKRAQLYPPAKASSSWNKRPDAMLRARAISKAVRMLAPEVVAGVYTPEEVEDFEPAPRRAPDPALPSSSMFSTPTTSVKNPESITRMVNTGSVVREVCHEWVSLTKEPAAEVVTRFLKPFGASVIVDLNPDKYPDVLHRIEQDYDAHRAAVKPQAVRLAAALAALERE